MGPQMYCSSALLVLIAVLGYAQAQTPPAPVLVESSFSTTFDTLQGGKEGTSYPYVQSVTVSGIWTNQDVYLASDGSSNAGGIYSFGSSGSSERGMGTITSNKKKTASFGASFVSNYTISGLSVSFEAEQFRYGGDNESDTLTFEFIAMTPAQYQNGGWGGLPVTTSGWTGVPALSFSSLVNGSSGVAVGALVNKTQILSANLSILVIPGNILQVRWISREQRDGLGIDNLQVLFYTNAVPTPPPNSPTPAPTPTSTPAPRSPSATQPFNELTIISWIVSGALFLALAALLALFYAQRKRMREEKHSLLDNHNAGNEPTQGDAYGVYGKYITRTR